MTYELSPDGYLIFTHEEDTHSVWSPGPALCSN
jgi:hypothetical protein